MSGKSRRGKKRRPDDGLAKYREYAKNPLYADYCKQVMTLVKRGRQKDLPDELLETCSPAAMLTAMLEISDYRCASSAWGCPVHASRLDRSATPEGVTVAPTISGQCPHRQQLLCLYQLLSDLGYDDPATEELN